MRWILSPAIDWSRSRKKCIGVCSRNSLVIHLGLYRPNPNGPRGAKQRRSKAAPMSYWCCSNWAYFSEPLLRLRRPPLVCRWWCQRSIDLADKLPGNARTNVALSHPHNKQQRTLSSPALASPDTIGIWHTPLRACGGIGSAGPPSPRQDVHIRTPCSMPPFVERGLVRVQMVTRRQREERISAWDQTYIPVTLDTHRIV